MDIDSSVRAALNDLPFALSIKLFFFLVVVVVSLCDILLQPNLIECLEIMQ